MKIGFMLLLLLSAPVLAFDSNPFAAASAVYRIEVPYGDRMFLGTGILISPDRILTNCHVVKHPPGWPRVIHRQTGQQFQPSQYYNLGNYDACVLVGNFTAGNPVSLASDFQIGEIVWHYGYPHGIEGSGQGPITGLVNTEQGTVIESASYCNPGSSGGPLLNIKGQLIGLNFAVRSQGNRDMCLSIPMAVLRPLLRM